MDAKIKDLIDKTAGTLQDEFGFSEDAAENVRYLQDVLLVVVKETVESVLNVSLSLPMGVEGAFAIREEFERYRTDLVKEKTEEVYKLLGLP